MQQVLKDLPFAKSKTLSIILLIRLLCVQETIHPGREYNKMERSSKAASANNDTAMREKFKGCCFFLS